MSPPRDPRDERDPTPIEADPSSEEAEDRAAIMARRAMFIASAIAGMSLVSCEGKVVTEPQPCLDMGTTSAGGNGDNYPCLSQGGYAGEPQPCLGQAGAGGEPQPCLDMGGFGGDGGEIGGFGGFGGAGGMGGGGAQPCLAPPPPRSPEGTGDEGD